MIIDHFVLIPHQLNCSNFHTRADLGMVLGVLKHLPSKIVHVRQARKLVKLPLLINCSIYRCMHAWAMKRRKEQGK